VITQRLKSRPTWDDGDNDNDNNRDDNNNSGRGPMAHDRDVDKVREKAIAAGDCRVLFLHPEIGFHIPSSKTTTYLPTLPSPAVAATRTPRLRLSNSSTKFITLTHLPTSKPLKTDHHVSLHHPKVPVRLRKPVCP
jgi:hypothetical protein